MKRILQILGMVSMVLMSFLPASSYDFEVNGIYYNILSAADLTCEVTSSPDKYTGTVTIPSTVSYKSKDLTVTAIGKKAFEGCSDLITVEIPECVTSIGDYAFKGCGFVTFEIPNSIQDLGDGIFADCKNITNYSWPDKFTTIPYNTFSGCTNLTTINLPSSLRGIGDGAFMGCGISNIELPDSISYIGSRAFEGCSLLSSIKIGPMVKTIRYQTFRGCSSLSSIDVGPNVECIERDAFSGCPLKSVLIPQVSKIETHAITDCTNLKEIGIAADVHIYNDGFFNRDLCPVVNCPNLHKLIVYPTIESYEAAYREAESTVHEWVNDLNITELDLRARCFSNVHSVIWSGTTPHEYYKLEMDSLETITLSSGQDLGWAGWHFYLYDCKELKQIFCDMIPPVGVYFTDSQYINVEVYVPDEVYETYTQTEPWKFFWNLKRMSEYSGTHDITTDADPSRTIVNRYDLNGCVVSDNYKGIVIVLFSDGTTKKIVQN